MVWDLAGIPGLRKAVPLAYFVQQWAPTMRAAQAIRTLALGGIALTAALGCSSDGGGTGDCLDSFKCDIPEGPAENLCVARRLDAFNENQYAFQPNQLRWSCADVAGVTGADRGQEYCEYFAMVQLPTDAPEDSPIILGRNLGEDYTAGTTEERLELSFDELVALESDESAIVGQCVFTSWNSDIDGPVAACANPEKGLCPSVFGLPVNEEIFRMKFGVNSADAAQVLVEDCMAGEPTAGDFAVAGDPLHDDFFRSCMLNERINETAFRKSDTTVCSASVRLAECGCAPLGDLNVAEYISPLNRLGFALGTWSDPFSLPAGCQYLDEGEGSDTLVTCDLSAAEVIRGAYDLKGFCAQKYADNVVVHVPLPPADSLTCDPSTSSSPYADTCSDTPWVLEPSIAPDRY